MIAESIVSWESVALVAAVCAGVVGVLKVRRNGGVSEDRVKTTRPPRRFWPRLAGSRLIWDSW
jgi:hypothetical protein